MTASARYVSIAVGAAWPHGEAPDGLTVVFEATDDGPALTLIAHINGLSPAELAAMRSKPLKLSVTPSSPLTWLAFQTESLSGDAPFSAGVEPDEQKARAALAAVAVWPDNATGLVQLFVVDRGRLAAIRAFSLSKEWFSAFARSVAACPPGLDRQGYDLAVARDAQLTTRDLIARATAIEVAGITPGSTISIPNRFDLR